MINDDGAGTGRTDSGSARAAAAEIPLPAKLKAKSNIAARDLKSLRALAEEGVFKRLILVSLEARPRQVEGISILPLSVFLDALWAGKYC